MASHLLVLRGMSLPREVEPGKTYVIDRRTDGRFHLFRPDESGMMQRIFLFCLGAMAAKHGILVHAVTLMSTHYHMVFTDVLGVLPDFLRDFHRLVAVTTKCHRGWGEAVFNKSQTTVIDLPSAPIMIDQMAYVIANPVEAAAVRYAKDWPGVISLPRDIGRKVFRAEKPEVFFRSPDWPAEASVPVTWPELVLSEMTPEEAESRLRVAVEDREKKARNKVRELGWSFMGARRCTRIPIERRSRAYEVWGSRKPTFATGKDRELFFEMVKRRRTFRTRYREALDRWRQGCRDVIFPFGTWLMHKLHGVQVEPAPT